MSNRYKQIMVLTNGLINDTVTELNQSMAEMRLSIEEGFKITLRDNYSTTAQTEEKLAEMKMTTESFSVWLSEDKSFKETNTDIQKIGDNLDNNYYTKDDLTGQEVDKDGNPVAIITKEQSRTAELELGLGKFSVALIGKELQEIVSDEKDIELEVDKKGYPVGVLFRKTTEATLTLVENEFILIQL